MDIGKVIAIFSRVVNRCWKLFTWGLCLTAVAAVAIGAYLYVHLDNEIRRQVERLLADHYRHLQIEVGSARFDPERGISIGDITIRDPVQNASAPALLEIGELFLSGAIRLEELLSGSLPIGQITVRGAKVGVVQQVDGRWNIAQLVPAPKFSDTSPEILIEDAVVAIQSPRMPRPLTLHDIVVQFSPASAGEGEATIREYQVMGSFRGLPARQARFHGVLGLAEGRLDVTFGVVGLEMTPNLVAGMPFDLPAAVKELQFHGLADIALRVANAVGSQEELGWSAQVRVQHGQVHHPRIHQPFTDVTFIAQANRGQLALKEVTAKWGQATIAAACNRSGWSIDSPLAVSLRVNNMVIDHETGKFLPDPCSELWNRFQPAGLADIVLQATFDGQKWRPHLTADCRQFSLTDRKVFPYRLDQVHGRVEYQATASDDSDRLQLDLTGAGGVRVQAQLTQLKTPPSDRRPQRTGVAAGGRERKQSDWHAAYRGLDSPPAADANRPHAVGRIEVSGAGVSFENRPLHEAVSAASHRAGDLINSLQPGGKFDFRWSAEWTDRWQPQANTELDLTLRDCSVLYDRFPYPLREIQGRISERNRKWELHDLSARGESDGAIVTCRGQVQGEEDSRQVRLEFDAEHVPLDSQLLAALPPGAQRAWEDLRPEGRIDLNVQVSRDSANEQPSVAVSLRPSDNLLTIEPRLFPFRLDHVLGEVKYFDGNVEFENFSGRHGPSIYSIRRGTWQLADASHGAWRLSLSGIDVSRPALDQELFTALPLGLQQVIARLRPQGVFAIYESSLNLTKQPGNVPLAADWDVNLDCHQVTLGGGLPLENVTGGIRLKGATGEKGSETFGELAIHSLTFKGMQFTSIRGPLWADRAVCLFGQPADAKMRKSQTRPITADAYGGSLTADIRIHHETATPTFRAELALGGADLNRFATERLGGPKDPTGVVSGKLALEGSGHSTQSLLGGGELHVVNANIYELPVLVALLKVLKNRTPNTTAFNRCDLRFQVQGERIVFQQIKLLGDAVSLYGYGETAFDRRLNMVFGALAGPADLPIPLLSTFARQASQQMLEIKVGGTWQEPTTQINALPTVNNMLEQIRSEFESGATGVASPSAMRGAGGPARR